jgi:phosphoribosylaminoimidazolecarboxamide formyltransferase/IMP cyclohydrolase
VDSCDLAVRKAIAAGHDLAGSVAASDAFFPFADGVERLADGGVGAIVQPGGSKRDPAVIAAADRLGIAMVLSHRRHFRH